MSRSVMLITFLVLLLTLHASAFAKTQQIGFYASAKIGPGIAQTDDMDFNDDVETYSIASDDGTDVVPVVGLALGLDFYKSSEFPMRVEIEYAHMNDADFAWQDDIVMSGFSANEKFEAEVSADTLLVNAYYDFRNASRFTPFVQAGLGLAILKTKLHWINDGFDMGTEKDTNVNFAANIGGGIGFALTEHLSVDTSYRFVYLGPAGVDNDILMPFETEADVWRHDILLGLRYTF
ncbi:opacity protein [Desulfocurvibacter africanus PCS]|uniref:Opacity protein n=1 Tax=Desulfocurvibacter africanus PCS TaxID=1262666 RepID=M5PU39_DESAF|nr:outer membrane beta-barrel protein [Desulfocurvibacter africanus]EMG37589.1 opacity protein [Desulfocurvibacter africanus PCS]